MIFRQMASPSPALGLRREEQIEDVLQLSFAARAVSVTWNTSIVRELMRS